MIRIIKGTFGWFNGRRVVPVTREDGPISVDRSLERRLVDEGVAEYVDAPVSGGAPDPEPTKAPAAAPAPESDCDGCAPALDDMTRAELADMAESLGIKPGKKTKAELAEAIAEAEQAPDLSAAEVE